MLVSAVEQSESVVHIHVSPLFGFPSHLGHHRTPRRVPWAKQQVLIHYLFYTQCINSVYMSVPISQFIPPFLSILDVCTFILYICVSISALQIRLSITFFQIPHVYVKKPTFVFLFLTSLGMTVSRSIHIPRYCEFLLCLWIFTLTMKSVFDVSPIISVPSPINCRCCSVTQLCPTLCDPMDCSTPGFPVGHHLPELAQTHVHWVGDAIQPSHPLSSPSPPAFSLS